MSTVQSHITYENQDHVAWITVNRPEAMNAFNRESQNAFGHCLVEAELDKDVRVIVLTGAGGKAFSAGLDLKEMSQPKKTHTHPTSENLGLGEVFKCSKPLIAAIDGYCLAGGLEIALGCDIRIATSQSLFGLPEPRRSLLPVFGMHNIPRMIPTGEALWILLTGSHMKAQRAYEVGLIQAILPDRDSLMAEAKAVARDITLCAPLAIQAIKRIVTIGTNLPIEYSKKLAKPIEEFIENTQDSHEGPLAFAEKRDPIWKMQ